MDEDQYKAQVYNEEMIGKDWKAAISNTDSVALVDEAKSDT